MALTWMYKFLPLNNIFVIILLTGNLICDKEVSNLIEIYSKEQFEELINEPSVTLTYFYKKGLPGLETFLKDYSRSADHLKEFKLNFALADCSFKLGIDYCEEDYTEFNVYGFREGQQKISLPLETVFDVNSIVASALHLSMAAYLPITQTFTEREQVENRCKSNCNIVFGYQLALGTYDHRIFMEVAYSFNDHMMFALTTNTPVTRGLVDELESEELTTNPGVNSAIWVIFCKTVQYGENCSNVRYKGSIDTPSIARYLNNLFLPKWVDLDTDVENYQALKKNNHFFIYLLYDDETKETIKKRAQELGDIFHGSLGIAVLHVQNVPKDIMAIVDKDIHSKSQAFIFCNKFEMDKSCHLIREFKNVTDYITKQLLFDFSNVTNISAIQQSSHEGLDEDECCCEDLQQDDGIIMGLQRDKRRPTFKMIKALTETTFPEIVEKKDVFGVTFYMPWDPVCQAFFLSLDQATEVLPNEATRSLVFRINCADWPVLCDDNNITTYPTIKIFRKNKDTLDYLGLLGGREFLTTVSLYASKNPVILKSSEEMDLFAKIKHSVIYTNSLPATIVGLFSSDQDKEINAFKNAAEILHGQFLFGTFDDNNLVKKVAEKFEIVLPTTVIFKKNDKYQPHVLFNGVYNPDDIVKFVNDSYLPVFPELSAANFISYLRKQKPFVILFDLMSKRSHLLKELGKLAAEQKFPEVIFCWLPVDTSRNLGTSILFNYTKELVVPAVAILDRGKGKVYNYKKKEKTIDEIIIWIHEFLQGSLEISAQLVKEEWKPVNPGIDFLSLMDEDTDKFIEGQSNKDDLQTTSEQDIQDFQNSRIWKHYKQNALKQQIKEKMKVEPKVNIPHMEHTEL